MFKTPDDADVLSVDIEKNLSWEKKIELCKQWKRTGLSKNRFCKKHGLSLDEFHEWCNDLDQQKTSNLCELKLKRVSSPIHEPMVIELAFGHQVTARIQASEHQFGFLLQEVLHATSIIR